MSQFLYSLINPYEFSKLTPEQRIREVVRRQFDNPADAYTAYRKYDSECNPTRIFLVDVGRKEYFPVYGENSLRNWCCPMFSEIDYIIPMLELYEHIISVRTSGPEGQAEQLLLRNDSYALLSQPSQFVIAYNYDETPRPGQRWQQGTYYSYWEEEEKSSCLKGALLHFLAKANVEPLCDIEPELIQAINCSISENVPMEKIIKHYKDHLPKEAFSALLMILYESPWEVVEKQYTAALKVTPLKRSDIKQVQSYIRRGGVQGELKYIIDYLLCEYEKEDILYFLETQGFDKEEILESFICD